MNRSPSRALVLAALGVGLLAWPSPGRPSESSSSGFARHPIRHGGTLRVQLPVTDIDDIDPSIAFGSVSWQIQYSTALKLLNYPDAPAPRGSRLVPEGASSFRVSRDGRTYTFTIRPGFRFSDGRKVTARNYAYAINRAFARDLQSPGFQFLAGENGSHVVGAQHVRDGRERAARGVRVRGDRLIVELTKPDGTFLSKISAPFFQALPTSLPSTRKVIDVDAGHPLPAAGPYFVSSRRPNRLVTLRKNPFYARDVSRRYARRLRRLARIEISVAVDSKASYQEVRENRADFTLELPPNAPAVLAREHGFNGRFRVRSRSCISYIALNTSNPLFRDNPQLRQAVNFAIDRRAMVDLASPYTYLPMDQYLPRGLPGFADIDAYPFTADLARARALAAGRVPSGGPWIMYISLTEVGRRRAELVRAALREIGVEVELQGFRGGFYDPAAKRSSPHALAMRGWCADYPDPYNFINLQLHGGTIGPENNTNVSYFDNPTYNARMDRAARLHGVARQKAYAALEHDLVTTAAPWAVWGQPTKLFFFSKRIDPRSFVYQPIYEAPPFNLLALK